MNYLKMSVKKMYICVSLCALLAPVAHAQVTLPQGKDMPQIKPVVKTPKTVTPKAVLDFRDIPHGTYGEKLILDFENIYNSKRISEGPRTGGGGNSCSLAIVENSTRLLSLLEVLGEDFLPKQDLEKIKTAVGKVKFFVADRLVLEGETKDAINYPDEGKVIVSKNFCDTEMIEPSGRSMSLLLHEFLGLARIDDRQYQISRQFLAKYAEVVSEDFKVLKQLKAEAEKDIKGLKSCFKGALKRKDRQMEEDYGGRYQAGETPEITLHKMGEENYRSVDKYCHGYLDQNKKPTEDIKKAVWDICGSSYDSYYAVSAGYDFSTTGTSGTEPILFTVSHSTKLTMGIRRDSRDLGDPNTYFDISETKTLECQPVKTDK